MVSRIINSLILRFQSMRRLISIISFILLFLVGANGQTRTVQNRPYADLRPFHFGILLGTHLQDLKFVNVGMQTITDDDGTPHQRLITTDQSRWDAGFQVGVLGESRLTENFQLRLAPSLFFGSRHIKFQDMMADNAVQGERHQDMKTVYIATSAELLFDGPRLNNVRPYLLGGLSPMLNLDGKTHDYLKLKKYDLLAEVGMGVDIYLPYFKLRPELKYMFSLLNSLDKKHAKRLDDKSMLPYTNSVKEARSHIIALTFYFE